MNKYNYGKQPKRQKHKYFRSNKGEEIFNRQSTLDFIGIVCSQNFIHKCIVALLILILLIATVAVYVW